MKTLKKVFAGVLSLAVLFSVMVVFTGCNTVKNKTYAHDSRTYTIIVSLDPADKTKITETRTLTSREYWLSFVSERKVALSDLATATMTEAEVATYTEWYEAETKSKTQIKYEFRSKELDLISTEENEVSGYKEMFVYTAEYEVNDDVITVKSLNEVNDQGTYAEYFIQDFYIVDEKIEVRNYRISAVTSYAENTVLYISDYYASVK